MNRSLDTVPALGVLLVTLVFSAGCEREERGYRVAPPAAELAQSVRFSALQPGAEITNAPVKNGYEENAFALSEGKRLYSQFNCVGCHFHGGGGIGPALMDDKWIYGHNPEQIFSTIIEGRPNGMPAFGGKIPGFQVWQLAAYVRSMSGLASSDAAPGREDHLGTGPPENSRAPAKPANSGAP